MVERGSQLYVIIVVYYGDMETYSLDSLKPDPNNPRSISKQAFRKLATMVYEFGDLSGIINNQRTGQLIGGHRRVDAFKARGNNSNIQITQRYDTPTRTGTIAIGYVVVDGEPYNYRIVDWPEAKQIAANAAANKAGELADWDMDLLAANMSELSQLEDSDELLALTGFDEDELLKLSQLGNDPEPKPEREENSMSFKLTPGQSEIVNDAIMHVLANHEFDLNINPDRNGNALYILCKEYVESHNAVDS